jgi:hypothetical protein
MLATIVLDAYRYTERSEVARALNDLLAPYNSWSTAGIYCYWDYELKEALYLGLAVDLHQRFLQHNLLLRASPQTCKSKQIKEYFQTHEKLGFTIMLQSNLSQPLTRKFKKQYWNFWQKADADYKSNFGVDGIKNIRLMEGATIETVKNHSGSLPPWNRMNGSEEGRDRTTPGHIELLRLLTNRSFNDNVSRATLRELVAGDNAYGVFESFMHGLRISSLSLEKALEFNMRIGNDWMVEQILSSGYLSKHLTLP